MLSLEHKHPDVFQEFQSGKFVVCMSSCTFPAMPIDQAHEQANAVIKGEGGAIGVTGDPSALRRWKVTGSKVSLLATEYEIVFEARHAKSPDLGRRLPAFSSHCRLSGFDVYFTGEIENLLAFLFQIEYFMIYGNQISIRDCRSLISIDRTASHRHRCQTD